jgi:exonuclease III
VFLRHRTDIKTEPIRNIIILGDFNIFSDSDATLRALLDDGDFTLPKGIESIPGTNVPKDKKYDQIAFRARQGRFEVKGAGMFDYYEHVFTTDDEKDYRVYIDAYIEQQHQAGKKSPQSPKDAKAATTQYRLWRTYQMSDHLPLWAELRIDFADDYLRELSKQQMP